MTEIVNRYVTAAVFLGPEDADPAALAGPDDPAPWHAVDLTADTLRAAGAPALARGVDWSARLDLLYLDAEGLEDGIDLSGASLSLELRQPHGGIVSVRSSERAVSAAEGAPMQLEAAANQDSRNQVADPEAQPAVPGPGNRGRLIARWAAADLSPPPEGLWTFVLVCIIESRVTELARGVLEVPR
jgi:hypothetical protein